jgi:hypothetical protein
MVVSKDVCDEMFEANGLAVQTVDKGKGNLRVLNLRDTTIDSYENDVFILGHLRVSESCAVTTVPKACQNVLVFAFASFFFAFWSS